MNIWKRAVPAQPNPLPVPTPSPEVQASIDANRRLHETRQRIMLRLYERLETAIDQGRYADAGHLAGAIGNLNRR